MTIGKLIAEKAEEWQGTPFREHQRVKGRGCDCKGLIAGVAIECNRPEATSVEALCMDYNIRKPIDAKRLRAGMARLFDQVPKDQLEPGDILLIIVGGTPQHMAIYAPKEGFGGIRVIEAIYTGIEKVWQYRRRPEEIDSAWRWRALDANT